MIIVMSLFMAVSLNAQFTGARLQATGLTCAMCSNAINKALEKLPFVQTVRSDIRNSAFNIQFRKDSDVDPDEIKKAVENAGFAIGKLSITGNFDNVSVKNDEHIRIGNKNYHFLNITGQVLDGERTITLADKDFVTDKEFKNFKSATKMNCVNTGKAESCCAIADAGTRIYHVTI